MGGIINILRNTGSLQAKSNFTKSFVPANMHDDGIAECFSKSVGRLNPWMK